MAYQLPYGYVPSPSTPASGTMAAVPIPVQTPAIEIPKDTTPAPKPSYPVYKLPAGAGGPLPLPELPPQRVVQTVVQKAPPPKPIYTAQAYSPATAPVQAYGLASSTMAKGVPYFNPVTLFAAIKGGVGKEMASAQAFGIPIKETELAKGLEKKYYGETGVPYTGEPAGVLPQRLQEKIAKDLKPEFESKIKDEFKTEQSRRQFDIDKGANFDEQKALYEKNTKDIEERISKEYQAKIQEQYKQNLPKDFYSKIGKIEAYKTDISRPMLERAKPTLEAGALVGASFLGPPGQLAVGTYLGVKTFASSVEYAGRFKEMTLPEKILGGTGIALTAAGSLFAFKAGTDQFFRSWDKATLTALQAKGYKSPVITWDRPSAAEDATTYGFFMRKSTGQAKSIALGEANIYETGPSRAGISITKGKEYVRYFSQLDMKWHKLVRDFVGQARVPNIIQISKPLESGQSLEYVKGTGEGWANLKGSRTRPETAEFFFQTEPRGTYDKLLVGKPVSRVYKQTPFKDTFVTTWGSPAEKYSGLIKIERYGRQLNLVKTKVTPTGWGYNIKETIPDKFFRPSSISKRGGDFFSRLYGVPDITSKSGTSLAAVSTKAAAGESMTASFSKTAAESLPAVSLLPLEKTPVAVLGLGAGLIGEQTTTSGKEITRTAFGTRADELTRTVQITKTKPVDNVFGGTKEVTSLAQPQLERQAAPQLQLQLQPQVQRTRITSRITPQYRGNIIPLLPVIPPFTIGRRKEKKFAPRKKQKIGGGYFVLTKKQGKPTVITPKPLIKGEALAFGVKYTKKTERATFKLVPTKMKPTRIQIKPLTESQVYKMGYRPPVRKGRVLPSTTTFIQKRPTRLGTKAEVKAVQSYKTRKGIW